MVRGAALRTTALKPCGTIPDEITYAASKSVISVRINEVVESGRNELLRTEEDVPRLHFVQSDQTIRYRLDINFARVDPEMLNLIASVPVVANAAGDLVGFDSDTRLPVAAFGLEVWSRLAGRDCVDGQRQWGYTVFPYLKGGTLTGFTFANGLVSFNVVGAQTRRVVRWGVGPYDLEGPFRRLLEPVSGNTAWRTMVTTAPPPEETQGVVTVQDEIDGGTASVTSSDEIDGGDAANAGPWIIDGGWA